MRSPLRAPASHAAVRASPGRRRASAPRSPSDPSHPAPPRARDQEAGGGVRCRGPVGEPVRVRRSVERGGELRAGRPSAGAVMAASEFEAGGGTCGSSAVVGAIEMCEAGMTDCEVIREICRELGRTPRRDRLPVPIIRETTFPLRLLRTRGSSGRCSERTRSSPSKNQLPRSWGSP